MIAKNKAVIFLKILLSISILSLLIINFGTEAKASLQKIDSISGYMLLLAGFLFHFIEKLLRIYNFRTLMSFSKVNLNYLYLVKITFISAFYGFFIPGSVGPDIVRIHNLKEKTQNYAQPTAATLLLNVLTIGSAALICLFSISFMLMNDESFPSSLGYSVLLSSIAILLLCFIGTNSKLQVFCIKLINSIRLPFAITAARLTNKLIIAVNQITSGNNLALIVFLASLVIFTASIKAYFVSLALGLDIHIVHLMILMPMTMILGAIPISFAGIGIRESIFVFYLSLQGVAPGDALVMGIFISFFNICIALFGGLIQATQVKSFANKS